MEGERVSESGGRGGERGRGGIRGLRLEAGEKGIEKMSLLRLKV